MPIDENRDFSLQLPVAEAWVSEQYAADLGVTKSQSELYNGQVVPGKQDKGQSFAGNHKRLYFAKYFIGHHYMKANLSGYRI